jgi:integrase
VERRPRAAQHRHQNLGHRRRDPDLRKPRKIGRRPGLRPLTPATINRTVDRLRHMFNWAVGREYLDRTPFKGGTTTLIKKLHEENKRRRRIDEHEEAALVQNAPPHIQAMLIAALDTGMRQGEMLALRFADIDLARGDQVQGRPVSGRPGTRERSTRNEWSS